MGWYLILRHVQGQLLLSYFISKETKILKSSTNVTKLGRGKGEFYLSWTPKPVCITQLNLSKKRLEIAK